MVRTNSRSSEEMESRNSVEPLEKEQDSDNDDNDYEVEAIISHKKVRNKIIYTVSWVGYDESEYTDMTEEELEGASQLLNEYKKKHNLDAAPPSRSRPASSQRKKTKKELDNSRRSISVVSIEDENNQGVTPRRSARTKTMPSDGIVARSSSLRSANKRQTEVSYTPDRSLTPIRSTRNSTKVNGSTGRKRRAESDDDGSVGSDKPDKRPAKENSNRRNNERFWLLDDSSSESNNNANVPSGSPSTRQHDLVVFPSPRVGLFNNLEVARVEGLKCEGEKKSVKVIYKSPVRQPFKSFDIVDTRFVRHYAPQQLIDLYEKLLTA